MLKYYPRKMTYLDLVKSHFPDVDDKEADFILWEKTEFPLIKNPEIIEKQLEDFKSKATV
jgi:hypothetical protein